MRIRKAVFGAAALLALAGCAAASAGEVYVPEPLPSGVGIATASLVKHYVDLGELAADAELAVLARPSESREIEVGGLPFTIVEFDVERTLYGTGPETLSVRYTGGAELRVTELPSLPVRELEYLLVLTPFTGPDGTTGEYVVVGPGQWVRESGMQRFGIDVLDRTGVDGSEIPLDLDVKQLAAALR